MADFFAIRTPGGFTPTGECELPASWKMGDTLMVTVRKPRNGKLHRKAFVLLGMVLKHSEYESIDRLRAAMTIGAGYVDDVINPMTGEIFFMPKSWSFTNMDDIEFGELYSRLIDVALQIVPNSKRNDWEAAVDDIIRM